MKTLQFDFSTNMGGISRLFAIPVSSFVRLWTDHVNSLNYLTVRNREDIIDIYVNEELVEFTENYDRGVYTPELTGIIPKSNPINRSSLIKLESEYWYLLFQDNNGFIRLSGTENNQLSFKRTTKTGTVGQRNEMEFTFSGNQRRESYFIELVEMDDL